MADSVEQRADHPDPPPRRGLVIEDPRAIRALAHPARLAILDYLSTAESATATEAAEVCGLSPSATSYHLRSLAKWGLVEEAESRGDGRERRWRAAAGGWSTKGGFGAPGGVGAAQDALFRHADALAEQRNERWLAAAKDQPPEWQEAALAASSRIYLTASELEALGEQIMALLRPYRRGGERAGAPDSRAVAVTLRMFPLIGEDPGATPPA